MSITTFKFLHLLQLAIECVIRHMGISVYRLAVCSKKALRCVNTSRVQLGRVVFSITPQGISLILTADGELFKIQILDKEFPDNEVLKEFSDGEMVLPFVVKSNSYTICTSGDHQKSLLYFDFFTNWVRKRSIVGSHAFFGHRFNSTDVLNRCLNKFELKFKKLWFREVQRNDIPVSGQNLEKLFNFKEIEAVDLMCGASENFIFNGQLGVTDRLYISASQWITLENLASIHCRNISLFESHLSSNEINALIRRFLDGHISFSNFSINSAARNQWSTNIILNGISNISIAGVFRIPAENSQLTVSIQPSGAHTQPLFINIVSL